MDEFLDSLAREFTSLKSDDPRWERDCPPIIGPEPVGYTFCKYRHPMNAKYRSFYITGGASPIEITLLGRITKWCPSGAIDYRRRDRSLVELTRFRVPAFPLDDESAAECFGLEIARLLVDSCYRELVIERYETEKRRIQQRRSRR